MIQNALIYLTGGFVYTVHNQFTTTYALTLLRFLFTGGVLCWLLGLPYTALIMALSVLLADFRFFLDYNTYIDSVVEADEEF